MILSKIFLETEPSGIETGIELGIVAFALVLFALSITAYRNTRIKKILFAAAAFALFAIQLFVDSIEDYLVFLDENITGIIVKLLVGKGALPHHSFHVFTVWKRTGHEEKAHTLESMDSCRISWGLVTATDGPFVTVRRKPLTLCDGKLALGDPVSERYTRTLDARDDIEGLKAGKIVTVHWGVLCETISKQKAEMLSKYTYESMMLANQVT
jgi:hypothetical protein